MEYGEFFITNKYTSCYIKIIKRAISQNRVKIARECPDYVYYEEHHILPSSVFPEYKDLNEHIWNSVLLTAKEHYICHLLLTKMMKNKKDELRMKRAFKTMIILSRSDQPRIYGRTVSLHRIGALHSEETKEKMSASRRGEKNGFFGKKHSEETKRKMSECKVGDKNPAKRKEVRMQISEVTSGSSNPMFGKQHSEEAKQKMRKPRSNTDRMKKPKSPEHIRKAVETRKRNRELLRNRSSSPSDNEVGCS